MEYGWERTFPFLKVDNIIIDKLFESILENDCITNVIPISEGCRTTNYIVDTNRPGKKYILKIFFAKEQNYKKEIKLLTKLKEDNLVNVSTVYEVGNHEIIENREYAIYEYMEGKTIGKAISEGYILDNNFIKDVARFLARIHNHKFEKAGFLDENLEVVDELPPLALWYEKFMGSKARERLGKELIHKIIHIVSKNKKKLSKLDNDIRLVHGDFQGTNILIKDGKLCGVIDWEFAMAGHPLADIGQFFRYEEYFNEEMIKVFEEEYNKNSSYKLTEDWYEISKLRDLANLIQLINGEGNMPNKYSNIKNIIINNITLLLD